MERPDRKLITKIHKLVLQSFLPWKQFFDFILNLKKMIPSILFQTASSSGDPHVHVIKEVKPTDEGLYTCIAGNFIGQATASAYLEVNDAFTATPQVSIKRKQNWDPKRFRPDIYLKGWQSFIAPLKWIFQSYQFHFCFTFYLFSFVLGWVRLPHTFDPTDLVCCFSAMKCNRIESHSYN